MNESSSNPIRNEAERRFARQLARDCGPEERAALKRWLDESPEHERAYRATEHLWDELGELRGDPDMAPLRVGAEITARRMRERRTRARTWRGLAMAASVAAIAVAGVMAAYVVQDTRGQTLQTALDERRSEILADGSTVTLNVRTKVEAQLDEQIRQIVLHEGEALFDVEHDRKRPFVVEVGNGATVTALGTRFQVREDGPSTIVTLLEGSVRVEHRTGAARVLDIGQQARIHPDGHITVAAVEVEQATSWTRGWMVFRNQPLHSVVANVNRHTDRPIRIADPALADMPLSGNFYLGDSASMAAAMAIVLPIKITEAENEFVLEFRDSRFGTRGS